MVRAKTKIGKTRATSKKSPSLKDGVHKSTVERIVLIPSIDVYSELPFALVERDGERINSAASNTFKSTTKLAKSASIKTQKAAVAAKRPTKQAAKKVRG